MVIVLVIFCLVVGLILVLMIIFLLVFIVVEVYVLLIGFSVECISLFVFGILCIGEVNE